MVAELVIARTPSIFTFGREKKKKGLGLSPAESPEKEGLPKTVTKLGGEPRISQESALILKSSRKTSLCKRMQTEQEG